MNHTCIRHLGGTVTGGSTASGTRYASHTVRKPHTHCWMELCVFDKFPGVTSLAGTHIQQQKDLMASTKGAGEPTADIIRLEFELFDDESPNTCANFRRLCRGDGTLRKSETYYFQGVTPSFRGTYFHKIIPDFCAQGGDITMRVKSPGANYFNSTGRGWFADENKKRRHNEVGLLSMANNGPNTNGTQFFITTSARNEQAFNGRHVCFGRVTKGLPEFLKEVGPYGNVQGHPSRYVVVVDCGEGQLVGGESTFDLSSYNRVSHPLPHLPQSVPLRSVETTVCSSAVQSDPVLEQAVESPNKELTPPPPEAAEEEVPVVDVEVSQEAEVDVAAPAAAVVIIDDAAHADETNILDCMAEQRLPAIKSSIKDPSQGKSTKRVTIAAD